VEVLAFERRHAVRLPSDYRHFLTSIGNGGAGPYYGIFPLGEMDATFGGLQPWQERNGFMGALSEPFLLETEWNDLTGFPNDELLDGDEAEYDRQVEEFEKRYWDASITNGAIPICHEGCAIRIWLVATGSQAGRLWRDGRTEQTGIKPLRLADGAIATFAGWYDEWLVKALEAASARYSPNSS
jgi:hypothetical protein